MSCKECTQNAGKMENTQHIKQQLTLLITSSSLKNVNLLLFDVCYLIYR